MYFITKRRIHVGCHDKMRCFTKVSDGERTKQSKNVKNIKTKFDIWFDLNLKKFDLKILDIFSVKSDLRKAPSATSR